MKSGKARMGLPMARGKKREEKRQATAGHEVRNFITQRMSAAQFSVEKRCVF